MVQYQINKGVDKPIEFKGLKGQYVYFMMGGVLGTAFLTMFLSILDLPMIIVIPFAIIGFLGSIFFSYRYNNKYGRWGLDWFRIGRKQPKFIVRSTGNFRKMLEHK